MNFLEIFIWNNFYFIQEFIYLIQTHHYVGFLDLLLLLIILTYIYILFFSFSHPRFYKPFNFSKYTHQFYISFDFPNHTHQMTPSSTFLHFLFFFALSQLQLQTCIMSIFFSSIENLEFFFFNSTNKNQKSKFSIIFVFLFVFKKSNPNLDWDFFKNYLKFSQKVTDLRK